MSTMSSIFQQSTRTSKRAIYRSDQQRRESGPESRSPSTSSCSDSDDALRQTLAKLSHLDLTRHVQHDSAVMKAHGGYCDVFMGSVNISSPGSSPWDQSRVMKVAIKRLRVHIQTDRDFAKLLAKELHVWSKLDHVNILPLVGYVLEGDYPSVISEWIENGTVGKYMKENLDIDVGRLILGIANGVEYLHKQHIVHSDLKADNVLVGRFGEPLICDFGISRMLASSLSIAGTSTGGLKGSVRWMAFELLDITGDAHHTKETDVWAFGMTVYEILTKEIPYIRLKHDVLVMFAILQGELPPLPLGFDDWPPFVQFIWKICEECWVSPPECRITMEQVMTSLDAGRTANNSPEPLQLPRDSSPTLTSMTYSSVPPLTPDYSSSSSEDYSSGRVSCSPDFQDPTHFLSTTPLFSIEEDLELEYLQSGPSRGLKPPFDKRGNGTTDSQPVKLKYRILSPTETLPPTVLSPWVDEAPAIDKLLLRGSPSLVDFDLRCPITSVRKLVFGAQWTHLNYHDLSRAACNPPCRSIHLATAAFSDWIIEVQCVPSRGRSYVSIKDVLLSVHRLLHMTIEQEQESGIDGDINTENAVFDVVQCWFGGLFVKHGSDGSRSWEVEIVHAKPSGLSTFSHLS